MELTHFNKKIKKIEMVDISNKSKTKRIAEAKGLVKINKKLFQILKKDQKIFDKLSTTAKIAGVLAAKNTSNLIPLTHNIPIDYISLSFELKNDQLIEIKSLVKSNYTTGLEIEALNAVSTAALTLFDMLKSYKQKILIHSIEITKKRGGKITLDDIFQAIKNINKSSQKDYTTISISKLNTSHFINSIEKIKVNIPPYNQSSMDGYAVINKSKRYKNIGTTSLNKYIDYKIQKNQCVEVKTGSLIPQNIKYIIPLEYIFKNKNEIHCINYNFKEKFIRPKGHIFKKNTSISKRNSYLNYKDLSVIKSLKNLKSKIQKPLTFSIISTGSEFTKDHFIKPTNGEYLRDFLLKNHQKINDFIHIKDDFKLLNKYLNKFNSNFIIVIGGTGKSKDDIKFEDKNLIINGLNLKPGRPFKYFYKNKTNFIFFPGNPCSSFVLTNILIKELLDKYFGIKSNIKEEINISKLNYNFNKLRRKTFLFALKDKGNFKIFKNQESSNLANILNSNYLLYFNQTKKVKAYRLND